MRPILTMLLALSMTGATRVAVTPPTHEYLYVWISDSTMKSSDFVAVVDADRKSPHYGEVVATLPVGASGMAHHTEATLAPGGHLLANDFELGRTWLFDFNNPSHPKIITSFDDLAGYTHPHSFIRLANGNVLATYQYLAAGEASMPHSMSMSMKGTGHHRAGGLVEMSERGRVIRSASAQDASAATALLFPYSVAAIPSMDRALSTTTDMDEADTVATSEWIQIWRLSDLKLLRSIALPPGPRGDENRFTGEPRLLPDGRSAYVHTFNCGLYLVRGIDSPDPATQLVHTFDGKNCGVPVLTGHYWIQTVPKTHSLVALDVSNPARPREVSHVSLGDDEHPHWLAIDGSGRRLVVNSGGQGTGLFIVDFDPRSGALAVDSAFHDARDTKAGVTMTHRAWPHGFAGAASPHGAVFSR